MRLSVCILLLSFFNHLPAQDYLKEWGIVVGLFNKGALNSIVDVPGVAVGHFTLIQGDSVRTGVTAILPHQNNLFQEKVPAAIHIANGFGKLAGYSQVKELGNIEAPILLTNTLSVSAGIQGGIQYSLEQEGNANVRSVNVVVGETNDGRLNDIRGLHVTPENVLSAINSAQTSEQRQGNIGAGTGTIAFGFKGGIGMASRKLPASLGGYTIGILVQSNFGGNLEIAGAQIGKDWDRYPFKNEILNPDGSCMIIIATDAPILSRNLERLAKRAMLGFAKTGGMSSNGSGDYVIAFSTAQENRVQNESSDREVPQMVLRNNAMSALFQATIEATEEAIINSLLHASSMTGFNGRKVEAIDHERLKKELTTKGF